MTREPLERLLEPSIDEARIAATWQRIAMASGGERRRAPRWPFVLATAVGVALALVVMWPRTHDRGPLASKTPAIGVQAGSVVSVPKVAFEDGAMIDLDRDAHLQVLANDSDRFIVSLPKGRVRFDVPNGQRRWQIETPEATIEVATPGMSQFVVDADAHHVAIEVTRGVLMVRGERVPDRARRLTTGEHLTIEEPVAKAAVVAPVPTPTPAPVIAPPVVTEAPHPVAPPKPPVVATPVTPKTDADLVHQADLKRAAGDARGAAALLERARVEAHDAETRGLADFSLGRIYLEQLGDPDRAAAAFARMIALGTPSGLIEDAHARRIEALVRGGHHPEAVTALDEYDHRFPHGLHSATLHALVAK